jgi:hypothetical protein
VTYEACFLKFTSVLNSTEWQLLFLQTLRCIAVSLSTFALVKLYEQRPNLTTWQAAITVCFIACSIVGNIAAVAFAELRSTECQLRLTLVAAFSAFSAIAAVMNASWCLIRVIVPDHTMLHLPFTVFLTTVYMAIYATWIYTAKVLVAPTGCVTVYAPWGSTALTVYELVLLFLLIGVVLNMTRVVLKKDHHIQSLARTSEVLFVFYTAILSVAIIIPLVSTNVTLIQVVFNLTTSFNALVVYTLVRKWNFVEGKKMEGTKSIIRNSIGVSPSIKSSSLTSSDTNSMNA